MEKDEIRQLQQGMATAFIDRTNPSNLAYKPQFISNNYKEGRKVLTSIEDELRNCDEFFISVAFVTLSGITPLLQTLKELEKKQIKGRILTTNYLNFSNPDAMQKLQELSNVTVKMYWTEDEKQGFHTKGYVFRKGETYRVIIGSSNMTLNALTTNQEWNTKIVSTKKGEFATETVTEFERLWNAKQALDYDDFIELYREKYNLIKEQRRLAKAQEIPSLEAYRLEPNSMQTAFISNLRKIREAGEDKTLLISATGTGKTYASAFAMRELGFKKVLFLVHRNQIARQARKSFRKVFAGTVSMGLVSGQNQDYDSDYIFATMQTICKEENLKKFDPKHFDAIIYDECHHITSQSYRKIMDYFQPQFTLGMTATPDKRDDHVEENNVYEIFNHCIAYEIRLQQAMQEDLLCPFHYFGITDLSTISDYGNSKQEQIENFRYLTSDARVDYIIEQAKYYGYCGDRVKGLIFCSRIDEAEELSAKMNERGLRTVALSGNDSEAVRSDAMERLAGEEGAHALDYILSVDIFSEGVDIVEVNQVIMLRPTQSPIVFIQQLGRGLRKADGKEYVVVLDFIGNYNHNFMIPIALSGDRSYNKDNIRRYVMEGGRIIPGASTIHFDEISRKRIFNSIDQANFSDIRLIRENYTNLKNKLGHIPTLMDFDKYGEMDVLRIFDNKSLGSYYKFLVKYEKEYKVRLSQDEEKVVEFISKKLANGKRVQELLLLQRMLTFKHNLIGLTAKDLQTQYGLQMDKNEVENIIHIMTNEFPSGSAKNSYPQCIFLQKEHYDQTEILAGREDRIQLYSEKLLGKDTEYRISDSFFKMLKNHEFYETVKELIAFGIARYQRDYSEHYQDTNLVLYQKYTYEDACRLLNWEHNEVPLNIGGYKFDKKTKTFPVFINYDKTEDISDTTKYEDHFTSVDSLVAISKSGRSMESEDVQNFLKAKERGIDVHLFVRKNKDDKISKEFYYLGRMQATGNAQEFVMTNTDKTAVEIEWQLDTPVREDIYSYIVNV